MVSRNVLKSNYKQVGGTCLLASYAFLLEYAGVFERSWIIHNVYDVFSAYLRFHGTLEPVERLTSDQIRSGGRDAERMVGKAINRYCISHGGIAGYRQIDRFHRWLASKGYFSGIDVVDVAPPLGAPRSKPIAGVYRTVSSFLRQESAKEYHGALILYLAGGRGPYGISRLRRGFLHSRQQLSLSDRKQGLLRFFFPGAEPHHGVHAVSHFEMTHGKNLSYQA